MHTHPRVAYRAAERNEGAFGSMSLKGKITSRLVSCDPEISFTNRLNLLFCKCKDDSFRPRNFLIFLL